MTSTLLRLSSHIRRSTWTTTNYLNKHICCQRMSTKAEPTKEGDGNQAPLSYLNSKAAVWRAESTRKGTDREMLWFQPYVVVGSVVVFLLYFCVFREENDLDAELEKSLYDRVPGLEITHLMQAREYNISKGKDVKAIDARIKEIYKDIPIPQ